MDLTTGNPFRSLLKFAIPVILGNLFQLFYTLADSVIVGKTLGADSLAAVGSTSIIIYFVFCFINGFTGGFGICLGQKCGAKDEKGMRKSVAVSTLLSIAFTVVLTLICCLLSHQILRWMQIPADISGEAYDYMFVVLLGTGATVFYNMISNMLRALGDSKTPLYFLVFSSVLNIVLDIFFIVVVKAGTAGAAYATVISQGIAAVLSFIVMFKKYDLLRTSREDYYMDWSGIWHMLSIGLQMALNYSITAIGTMIFQAAVNVFGSQVVAAYTAASKVSNIATQTMPTLGTAAATYCGQNLGAGRYDRIFKGMKSCFFICIGCAVLAAANNCFVGPYMIGWFITSPTATDIDCAMKYLKIASVFMLPLAWIFAYRNGLQGLNKGLVPMLSGAMELVSRWIAILALSKPFGYGGVCFADPAAWLTTGILLIVTYYVWEMRMRKKVQIK